ncbi:sigma-70 family RNA polymerase sigma factor [Noviherbaspirillum saxi]|nr:sigma-70 family RNA polymerase sigma factor [Noviherbaspirillum saxi]
MPNEDFDYEAQLLACARGERAALRRLYDREARWLMGVALRIVRRREIADEVLHDAFLQIWSKASTYNPSLGSARGWIYSVVRHRALNTIRDSHHEVPASETMMDDIVEDASGPLEILAQHRAASALHHCLNNLDTDKRTCILLAYVDGYTHAQIAAHLQRPLGTVKAWTRRALLLLRECLS